MNKEEIFEILEEAKPGEVDEYLDAILNRKRELYPDWDIWYLAVHREDQEGRKRLIEKLMATI